MSTRPCNRYILVNPRAEEQKENSILLPEDYSPSKPRHEIVKVLAIASDCSVQVERDDEIIVDSAMIEEIKVGGDLLHFILENYVVAVINK